MKGHQKSNRYRNDLFFLFKFKSIDQLNCKIFVFLKMPLHTIQAPSAVCLEKSCVCLFLEIAVKKKKRAAPQEKRWGWFPVFLMIDDDEGGGRQERHQNIRQNVRPCTRFGISSDVLIAADLN